MFRNLLLVFLGGTDQHSEEILSSHFRKELYIPQEGLRNYD